jgi:hypothetical protein
MIQQKKGSGHILLLFNLFLLCFDMSNGECNRLPYRVIIQIISRKDLLIAQESLFFDPEVVFIDYQMKIGAVY